MSSYFEKLTSMNGGGGSMSLRKGPELAAALNRIDELRDRNAKLNLDLKCECDEKADLVSLKVGLENEVLNLREVNDRLEFQVQQLRVEKDKIHNALARVREELGAVASGGTQFRKFPSLDDLSFGNLNPSPSTSPTPMIRLCVTPTQAPLEKITEEDETLLESLVAPNHTKHSEQQALDASTESLLARIASLESENRRLATQQALCLRCKTRPGSSSVSLDEDGLVLLGEANDDDDDDEFEDDGFEESKQKGEEEEEKHAGVEEEINVILDMQRKIIEKLETELNSILLEEDPSAVAASVSNNVSRLKLEVERKMGDILRIVKGEVAAAGKNNSNKSGDDAAATDGVHVRDDEERIVT